MAAPTMFASVDVGAANTGCAVANVITVLNPSGLAPKLPPFFLGL
jgi:hypothetical protein